MPQYPSYTDLIFTDQTNLIVDSHVRPSLYCNCHHQITYCKVNLNIKYPPPYERLVWDYNWELLFSNKSAHKQVSISNETLINKFSDVTPNKLLTFDDKDPPWMNDFIKSKLKWKNQLYETYAKIGYKLSDHLHLQQAVNLASEEVAKRKQDYCNKLALRLKYIMVNFKNFL